MKLIWHIVRKDARRLWLSLALWVMLMTLAHGLDWRAQHVVTDDKAWTERMKLFATVFSLLGLFVGYVLAAALVMEDPPAGTTVFWMTRPMSGARVLGAKILGCAILFAALPVLVALPWWLLEGRDGPAMFTLTREVLRWQAWTIGLGVAVATFTRGGGQFLGGTLVVQAAILAIGIAWSGDWVARANLAGAARQLQLAKFVAVAGVSVAVFVQHQTRRKGAAWIVIGASLAGALAIGFSALA